MANFTFEGSTADDIITAAANGQHILLTRDTGHVATDVNGAQTVTIDGEGGNDMINASGLLAGLTQLVIDGGSGNDTIVGSQGADALFGGSGNDVVTGGRGNDVAFLGSGDDRFIWNPGDGSDAVDGGSGLDTLLFNGSAANENISISANGERATLFRDVGGVTMDLNSVERIEVNALGGADNLVANDLTGTSVKQVAIDLAAVPGGGAGDGQTDTVSVNGTAGSNQIDVTASGTLVTVSGLSAQVTIDHADSGDHLVINAGAGNDTVNASTLPAGALPVTFNGGAGNDLLIGGNENDTFLFTFGEAGHDRVVGFQAHGGGAQGDVAALAGFADHTFDQAVADGHVAQAGADVVISDGTNIVATLQSISLASLHANDFLFT